MAFLEKQTVDAQTYHVMITTYQMIWQHRRSLGSSCYHSNSYTASGCFPTHNAHFKAEHQENYQRNI